MGFDYRKFEKNASIGSLVRAGCSADVLKHAACRYAIASVQPGERRKALRQAGITEKQIKAQIAAAKSLAGFLGRLQQNSHVVAANQIPQQTIICLRRDLEWAANWLESLEPFRPDAKDAALALAVHVKQGTERQHLPEIARLLNAALSAARLPGSLTPETLRKQIERANRQKADTMLRSWESLAPARRPKK